MALRHDIERRSLQGVVAILSGVPIATGAAGILFGMESVGSDVSVALDSHFRYLSGIFFALGLVFLSTVPAIEHMTKRFRLATALVFCGGLGRLLSLVLDGSPGAPHLVGLCLELVVTPLLAVWQARVARLSQASDLAGQG